MYLRGCLSKNHPLNLAWKIILPGQFLLVSGQRAWWPCFLLALPTWHNFSRKYYFFFYKLIKQVTNSVFKKREAKGSGGRGFWGVCAPPVELNKWRPKRNERNPSQDSKRHWISSGLNQEKWKLDFKTEGIFGYKAGGINRTTAWS